ncbi:TetR family transcriptional regulator [Actinosynnema sp. ALI-1.44]|uniref:TetR/AcrR family transcriptional regulator n=1 Tax=Actinosynnema sp. ALI-1.44 TaxID=1933779 RepID=UPI00097C8D07|nr:TetR/AcrR family transcriptional regulator [Actinosynnema sp. ALI-1.44]ONI91360.1 TetR family transcriptional regulator [Actinosynnema sp. ALI-1.44]
MSGRPLRADAARNRDKVLRVAYETFAAEGLGVPIDEIARRAGVGAGTVYRHFPTKDLLFQAIVRDRVGQLTDAARALAAEEPGEAVYHFLRLMVDEAAVDQGLVDALAGIGIDLSVVLPEAERAFLDVLADLVGRAQRAGAMRSDVDVMDVKALMVGLQAMRRYRGDIDKAFQVVRDGLTP